MKRGITDVHRCCCFIAFLSLIQAIPVKDNGETEFSNTSSNRTAPENVCVHDNTIYAEGQRFSTSNPCETCVCDPPGVSCTLSSCDLKPGCKAIHKANRCCPEYVCECERNGKVYGNGEKVEEPNPCKVCYCKGGEIKCALVTCYTREDCEPWYVAGVCCPKYDHCPPLEMMKNKSTTPAPALVIISDLKTETIPAPRRKDSRKVVPTEATIPSEQTESTSERFASTEGSTYTTDGTTETATSTEAFETTSETTSDLYRTTEPDDETTIDVMEVTEMTTSVSATDPATTTEEMRAEIWAETTTTYATDEPTETTTDDTPGTEEYNATTEAGTEYDENGTEADVPDDESETTEAITGASTEPITEASTEPTTESQTMVPTTVATAEEKPNVVKVIIPKNMKKDLEVQVQKNMDGPAPIVVMISAEQIQFLKLAEEPPMYVQNMKEDDRKRGQDHPGIVVVPKTTPTTVEMVKVVEGTISSDVTTAATDFTETHVNISSSSNETADIIRGR